MGGRTGAQSPDEQLFMVDIPERPATVRKLLDAISPTWNVTLFHYRKTGALSLTAHVWAPPGRQTGLKNTRMQWICSPAFAPTGI